MNAPAKVLAFYDEEDRFYELYVRPLLPRAREDLVSQLMSGAKVYGHTMEDVLDEECQGERFFDLIELVAQVITAPTEEETRRAVATLRLHMNNRTRAYVTHDMVEDEAYRLAQEEADGPR